MPTPYEEVIARAMTYIKNDRSLQFDLEQRLPVFYQRMLGYLTAARTLFNRPPEVLDRTAPGTEPFFARLLPDTAEGIPAGSPIAAGVTDCGLCCAGLLTEGEFGGMDYTPLPVAAYDPAAGTVTLGEAVEAGARLELCFYRSGSFAAQLTETEQNILAYALYSVWETRQANDLLERKAKLRDSSFATISEASQTQAATERLQLVEQRLRNMIREYELDAEYRRVVRSRE